MAASAVRITPEKMMLDSAPSVPQAAASVLGLSKRFGRTSVLENISFDVAEGEVLVLLGASGSGKTTILRIMAGLEQPYTGKVILHGRDVTELPARERGVGVIFQSYALFPKMSVEKNIGYGLKIRKRRRKEIKQKVNELLELVQLEEHRKKYPSQLSGGQQQRVAIARTLAYNPEVLLFDEPFGALDTQTRTHLRREIRTLLKKINVPAIFITHDQEEALELGDRIAVLNVGHLEQIGTPEEIYNHPATEHVATFLGAANVVPGVMRGERAEIGNCSLPLPAGSGPFKDGQAVNLIFRPEDVLLSRAEAVPMRHWRLANGIVERINFVGAYERVNVRPDFSPAGCGGNSESAFYLTTETPESQTTKLIVATRAKQEATSLRLRFGDRVVISLAAYTILPV